MIVVFFFKIYHLPCCQQQGKRVYLCVYHSLTETGASYRKIIRGDKILLEKVIIIEIVSLLLLQKESSR